MRRASPLLVILIALLLSLGGCEKSRQKSEAEVAGKEASAEAKAEADAGAKAQADLAAARSRLLDAFQRRLKDPDSVKYRDVVVKHNAFPDKDGRRAYLVCGQYNAKNSMGGYGGYSLFVVEQYGQDEPTIYTTERGEPFASITLQMAKSMGCSTS